MSTLYLITGPAGVGKSTISNKLAYNLEKSVLIEGDDIYHQIITGYVSPWKEGNHLNTFWEIVFSSIDIYLKDGFNVVFNYIIDDEHVKKFKEAFKNYNIVFIVLMTDEKTILERDKERPIDCQMHDRCVTLLKSFKKKKYDQRFILDTTHLSANETVYEILSNTNFTL